MLYCRCKSFAVTTAQSHTVPISFLHCIKHSITNTFENKIYPCFQIMVQEWGFPVWPQVRYKHKNLLEAVSTPQKTPKQPSNHRGCFVPWFFFFIRFHKNSASSPFLTLLHFLDLTITFLVTSIHTTCAHEKQQQMTVTSAWDKPFSGRGTGLMSLKLKCLNSSSVSERSESRELAVSSGWGTISTSRNLSAETKWSGNMVSGFCPRKLHRHDSS